MSLRRLAPLVRFHICVRATIYELPKVLVSTLSSIAYLGVRLHALVPDTVHSEPF